MQVDIETRTAPGFEFSNPSRADDRIIIIALIGVITWGSPVFANGVQNPNVTNMRLMSQSMIGLLDKGGNENDKITNQLQMLAQSDTGMFNGVIEQILVDYPELASQIYGEGFEVVE